MYQAVNMILEKYAADLGAAEAHGMAAGMLCIERKADADNWLQALFLEQDSLQTEDVDVLLSLFETTRQLLAPETEEFGFDLLLPDDHEPLDEQAEALRTWCQGFLFGVGTAGAEWPGDSAEVIRDLVEISKIDSQVEGEDDEAALVEVHEYVRAAVLTLRDLFNEQANVSIH